jgi:hypothetical protein
MTDPDLRENLLDAERLLGKARISFGPNARAVRELTAEVATLKAEADRRGLKSQAEELAGLADSQLNARHADVVRLLSQAVKASGPNGNAARALARESAELMAESRRRGRARGNTNA